MPFAEEFINAYLAGQSAKENKQVHQQRQFDLQRQTEDRDIERQLLKHRITELKLQERLQARSAASQNLTALQGQSASDLPSAQVEEAPPPPYQGGDLASQTGAPGFRPKPVQIPGIPPELLGGVGVPDISVRPDTKESQLADLLAQVKIKMMGETVTTPRGGVTTNKGTGDVIATGQPISEPLVAVTTRDAKGRESTRWVTREEAAKTTATKERLPQRASTAIQLSDTTLDDFVAGIKSGNTPPDAIPKSALGVRVQARLAKDGFNTARAIQDQKAVATHYQALNSGEMNNIRVAADTLDQAVNALEQVQSQWQAGGHGAFSRAAVAGAKLVGGDKGQLAADFESAVKDVQASLAILKSGGSTLVNSALADAQTAITTGSDIPSAIRRLRAATQYRVAAIRNLEALTPTSIQGGAADFNYNPATGQLEPASK